MSTVGSRSGRRRGALQVGINPVTNTVSVNNFTVSGNCVVNADYISVGNSTVNNVINSVSITTGNTLVNTTQISVGGATINSFINSVSFVVPVGAVGSANLALPPVANSLAYYGKYKAGRIYPVTIDGSGWDTPVEAHGMHNAIYYAYPTPGATTFTTLRMSMGNNLTLVARTPATTNLFTSVNRMSSNTTASANSISSMHQTSVPIIWRGNAAGLGGFYLVSRFGMVAKAANTTMFVGLRSVNTVPVMNVTSGHLSAQTNMIGFGFSNAQTNLMVVSANATVSSVVDLGLDITTLNTNWYEAVIFAPPNGGTINYTVTNLTNNFSVSGSYSQTNLPSTTTFLYFQTYISNKDTAATATMDWGGVQIEVPT